MVWLHGTRKKNVQQGFLLPPAYYQRMRRVAASIVLRRQMPKRSPHRPHRQKAQRENRSVSPGIRPAGAHCHEAVQKARLFSYVMSELSGNGFASRLQRRRTATLKDEGANAFPDAPGKSFLQPNIKKGDGLFLAFFSAPAMGLCGPTRPLLP